MPDLPMGTLDPAIAPFAPDLVLQTDFKQCLSACLLATHDPRVVEQLGLTQDKITDILKEVGLASDMGVGLTTAEDLNVALRFIGLKAGSTYGEWGLDDDNRALAEQRLLAIDADLDAGKKIIIAYPRRRGEEFPFLHFSVISRVVTKEGQKIDFVMDPSEIDGSVKRLSSDNYLDYVTPRLGLPVMAWSIEACSLEDIDKIPYPREIKHSEFPPSQRRLILPGEAELWEPLWLPEHAGLPIPSGTDHPISVAMPTYEINEQFGNYGDTVLSRNGKRPYGYPRFVIDPWVRELSVVEMGSADWLPFSTKGDADAALYLAKTYDSIGSGIIERNGLFWIKESEAFGLNRDAWQYTGRGISSRHARAVLEGRGTNDLVRRGIAEREIKDRISSFTNAFHEDIYLFSSGMEAINVINEILKEITQEAASIQFGFPYADTFSTQKRLGPHKNYDKNIIDIRNHSIQDLIAALESGAAIRSLFMEFPGNPLLEVPSLQHIAEIVNGKFPIVLDPTVATMFNVDPNKLPDGIDVQVTSLTKFFSSVGDVMGGSIVLNPNSPFYEQIKAKLEQRYVNTVWFEDMETLAKNSREFSDLMPIINENGQAIAHWLHDEYAGPNGPLRTVYHPTLTGKQAYEEVMRQGAGFGGLMTFDAKNPKFAYDLYNLLKYTKGPSLGGRYSLLCLYTILAHSKELDSVAKFGVKRDLLRFSAGKEPLAEHKDRFGQAIEEAMWAAN